MPGDNNTEAFICHSHFDDDDRNWWVTVLCDVWKKYPFVWRVEVLSPDEPGDTAFCRTMLQRATRLADAEVFIVADDDCLPPSPAQLNHAITVARRHGQYGVLSLMPRGMKLVRWTPVTYETHEDDEVIECCSVGGIRLIRSGTLSPHDMPEMQRKGYGYQHCQAVRDKGFRCGYIKGIEMVHFGKGKSTIWGKRKHGDPCQADQ